MEVRLSDVGDAWVMERLVEGVADIPAEDRDHYKHCSMVEEGGNKDSWTLGVVVKSPGDSPPLGECLPYQGV